MVMSHLEVQDVSPDDFERFSSPMLAKVIRATAGALKGTGAGPLKGVASSLESAAAREEKIADIMRIYSPFTAELKGPFDCSNTRAAYARLSPEDQAKLPWSPQTLDWYDWMQRVHMPALEIGIFPEMEKKLKRETRPLRAHTARHAARSRWPSAMTLGRAPAVQETGFAPITYAEVKKRADALRAPLGLGREEGRSRRPLERSGVGHGVLRHPRRGRRGRPRRRRAGHRRRAQHPPRERRQADPRRSRRRALGEQKNAPARSRARRCGTCATSRDGEATRPRPSVEVADTDVASLIYTSGTTGVPKGVMLSHANFTSLIAALAPIFALGKNDRVLSVLPLHHTFEFTCGLLLPLSRGARVAYLDEINAELSAALKQGRITAMVGVPARLAAPRAPHPRAGPRPRPGRHGRVRVARRSQPHHRQVRELGPDLGRVLTFAPVHSNSVATCAT
ncbi:MAG: AMP-binding protein [Polyangiaceae bacterium]